MQQGFDLDTLLRFTPPHYQCERCYAFLGDLPESDGFRCPVCGVAYVPTGDYPSVGAYLTANGLSLRHENSIAHGKRMALLGRRARAALGGHTTDYPPMRAFLEALTLAQHCVHFTTFGISAFMFGALKLAAQRIAVRGIISGIKRDEMAREVTQYADEAPRLQTRVFGQNGGWFPHQKLLVIDGMLAFKGSANLTDIGWRKAGSGGEVIEVVTDLREVIELNNRFFSPVWATFERTSDDGATVAAPTYGGVS
jgi:hypothetical protein